MLLFILENRQYSDDYVVGRLLSAEESRLSSGAFSKLEIKESYNIDWNMIGLGDIVLLHDGRTIAGGSRVVRKISESKAPNHHQRKRNLFTYHILLSEFIKEYIPLDSLLKLAKPVGLVGSAKFTPLDISGQVALRLSGLSLRGFLTDLSYISKNFDNGTMNDLSMFDIHGSRSIQNNTAIKNQDFTEEVKDVNERIEILKELEELFANASLKHVVAPDKKSDKQSLESYIKEYSARNSNRSPQDITREINIIRRDYALVRALKLLYQNCCQVCGFTFMTDTGDYYSEAAHIIPMSSRMQGVDTANNILILCANHHKMLDKGAMHIIDRTRCIIDGKYIDIKNIPLDNNSLTEGEVVNANKDDVDALMTIKHTSPSTSIDVDLISPVISPDNIDAAKARVHRNSKFWPGSRRR